MTTREHTFPPLISSKEPQMFWWQRKGLLGLWLHLTAPPRPADMSRLSTREHVRKAELVSLAIMADLAFLAMMLSDSLGDQSIAQGSIITVVVLVITAFLNRSGRVATAAYLLVSSMFILLALTIVLGEVRVGLSFFRFPSYDLFAAPIFISALIIHPRAAPILSLVGAVFVMLTYSFAPHAIFNGMGAHNFDEMHYELAQPFNNWWSLICLNVSLLFVSGFFGWPPFLSRKPYSGQNRRRTRPTWPTPWRNTKR